MGKPEFQSADQDGDGVMNLAEFTRFDSGQHYHETTFKRLMDLLDSDGDNHASADEFLAKRQKIISDISPDDVAGDTVMQWLLRLSESVEGSEQGSMDER